MKRLRIDPPYKAYALRADGTRRLLDAHGIVVELRPGVEIEIDLAPHPNFAGHLTLETPPYPLMQKLYDEGTVDDFAVIFGGSNTLHVLVERRIRRPKAAKAPSVPKSGAGTALSTSSPPKTGAKAGTASRTGNARHGLGRPSGAQRCRTTRKPRP